MPFHLAGQAVDDPSSRPGAGFNMVTPEYFRAFGIRMITGARSPNKTLRAACRRRRE